MTLKLKIKHILGIIVALFVAWIIHSETIYITSALSLSTHTNIFGFPANIFSIYLGDLFALLSSFLILFLFFKYGKNNLGNYLILSIIISIFVVFLITIGTGVILRISLQKNYIQDFLQKENNGLLLSIISLLYFLFIIVIFILTFQILVKRKIKYLEYITREVKNMEKNGFGKTLEIKGYDELSILSQGINQMSITLKEKQELEKAEEEKKLHLIADISHDIRTPLTSVIGYTELLNENLSTNPEKCPEYLEVIQRRLNNMKSMVDQLFDYTKLTQNDFVLHTQKVNLVPLFQYIDIEYKRIYKIHNLSWKLDLSENALWANIDTETFLRAMGNLLDNAKKYATKNSEIVLVAKQEYDKIIISLSNETNLAQPLDTDKIFERFFRLDEARTGNSSTGLGLPIVKRIVELHNGTITATTQDAKIEFKILLPKA